MPSKTNTKGSNAKNQADPISHGYAGIGYNSNVIMAAATSLQADLRHAFIDAQQNPSLNRPEPSQGPIQAAASEFNREGAVNKKKQKRRKKEAAKRATGDGEILSELDKVSRTLEGFPKQPPTYNGETEADGYGYDASDYDDQDNYEPDEPEYAYPEDEATQQGYKTNHNSTSTQRNGNASHDHRSERSPGSKSKKKGKNRSLLTGLQAENIPSTSQNALPNPPPPPPPPPPRLGTSYIPPASHHSHDAQKQHKIWNTSTTEERENIKEFWLSLGEEDRRSLVKVEKEAVLKKMKEQQKHSCNCTVCGRKRTAIEEELEVLYDAYYEELEQYANHQHVSLDNGASITDQPQLYHPMSRQRQRVAQTFNQPSLRGRLQELEHPEGTISGDKDSDVLAVDGMSDDDDDSEEPPENSAATDFFNFGNSLTVQGGILTVADDLLKNDGKKFIEMMEQLAERRMQREEDAQSAALGLPMQHSHSSNLEPDLYDDEEDDEEDYDSGEDDEYEDDEMEAMTEEQRMEEGRRMFQIFAARMFEQRVLTAYREKMALERQQKLIEEVENEKTLEDQQKAKKAKEAQKKKDKKRQQKQAKDEEKAKREAELVAQEAATKALEEKKAEEQRQKKEEQRKRRDAEKKALEDERQKKEADKQRRLQEAKQQQQEQERKHREQKEREKKKKEEAKKKEREDREAKDKEAKEKKEREAAERRDREDKAKADDTGVHVVKSVGPIHHSLPVRPPPTTTSSLATPAGPPPGLFPSQTSSIPNSPHHPIAIPVVPKAPTPMRARQPSFQDTGTNPSIDSVPLPSSTTSPNMPSALHNGRINSPGRPAKQPTPPQQLPTQNRFSSRETSPRSTFNSPAYPNLPAASGVGFSPPVNAYGQGNDRSSQDGSLAFPAAAGASGNSFSLGTNGMNVRSTNSMPPPPLNNLPGNHFGGVGQSIPHRGSVASHTHSRNTSTSSNVGGAPPTPISRPAPKQRPLSIEPSEPGKTGGTLNRDSENGAHLGSSALLGDSEDLSFYEPRRGSIAPPGGPLNTRGPFGGSPGFPTAIGTSVPRGLHGANGTWSSQQQSPFGAAPNSPWPSTPGFGRQTTGTGFGSIGSTGPQPSITQRAVTVRTLIANACQKLSSRSAMSPMHGWHPVDSILRDVNLSKPQQLGPVEQLELITLCDTVGNTQNGGGIFDVHNEPSMGILIRFTPGRSLSTSMGGEIGSPIGAPAGGVFGNPRPFS